MFVIAGNTEATSSTKLTADEIRMQGQADASWLRYASTWRKFKSWLEDNGHDDCIIPMDEVKTPLQIFKSVKVPLSQVSVY